MPPFRPDRAIAGWAAGVIVALVLLAGGYEVNKQHEHGQTVQRAQALTGGDPQAGQATVSRYGCGGCHTIPGAVGARGLSGPPLAAFGQRVWIAGMLRNTPQNLITWIKTPQTVVPGNAMPNLGVSDRDARDIAAYLYTVE